MSARGVFVGLSFSCCIALGLGCGDDSAASNALDGASSASAPPDAAGRSDAGTSSTSSTSSAEGRLDGSAGSVNGDKPASRDAGNPTGDRTPDARTGTVPPRSDAGQGGSDPSDGGGSASARPGWKLVWSDEFDGNANALPDATRWAFETGGDGFGNNQQEFDTARPENASLNGKGQLVLTARKEAYMGRQYTSARLKTAGKFERRYGRYEARMRIPEGQGIWPAFWMLGSDIGSAGWPMCGEIDIMENIGREPSLAHGTLHGPGYSGGGGIGAAFELKGARLAEAFHEFAIEWEDKVVRWYVDGQLYQTRTPADLPGGAKWVYDHSFFLLLNLAVGGQWPGNPDATTVFPQQLTVDYVRVYERAER